jgi:DNA-binding MarR family transcriptional regulator
VPVPHNFRAPQNPTTEEQAYIALARAADWLATRFALWLKPHNISPTQYNALRILRGARPDGLPCSEIGNRMLTHDSDITRLVDRLEKRKWVTRSRDKKDRRIVRARITEAGLRLLGGLDLPVRTFVVGLLGNLTPDNLAQLTQICEAIASQDHAAEQSES